MEIAPGLHCVETSHGDRLLHQYLLIGDRIALVDAGVCTTPEEVIFPYLTGIGASPSSIQFVIITHGDVDHYGGLHAIRQVAPWAIFMAHHMDAAWIADPNCVMAERYNRHQAYGVDYGPELNFELRRLIGKAVAIDLALSGGETLYLRRDWPIHIHHVPGHTPGQICLHDPAHAWAIITDAITGRAQVNSLNQPTTPPYYYHRQHYLDTTWAIEGLGVDQLWTSHYPFMQGEAAKAFIHASRDFVYDADQAVQRILDDASEPLHLSEIMQRVNPLLGPFDGAIFLAESIRAHLEWFVEVGKARQVQKNHLPAWSHAGVS
jgi:glyoxylase-like metal-dependent hydrolase (beta-lactamase superfamily II)